MKKFDLNIDNLNLKDKNTWDLLCSGQSLGVFQLDSHLGQSTCKKVRPRNIKELADVITLIRPGCLEAKLEDGNNILEHYVARKHKAEEPTSLHPALDDILGKTHHLLLFQEQAILISQKIAGFSLEKADELRKILGKKL